MKRQTKKELFKLGYKFQLADMKFAITRDPKFFKAMTNMNKDLFQESFACIGGLFAIILHPVKFAKVVKYSKYEL